MSVTDEWSAANSDSLLPLGTSAVGSGVGANFSVNIDASKCYPVDCRTKLHEAGLRLILLDFAAEPGIAPTLTLRAV